MKLFDYKCRDCNHKLEELVSSDAEAVECPNCGSESTERALSACHAHTSGKSGGSCAPSSGIG